MSIEVQRNGGDAMREIMNLPNNSSVQRKAKTLGLNVQTVCWEDTGRWKNSSIGPNISDMTLLVDNKRMPVIRVPNYDDISVDLDIDKIRCPVGNENGSSKLSSVSLREYLTNISKYTGNTNLHSMFIERDEKVICQSQCCILPLESGKVDFNVGLYNYQTYDNDEPAVLVIVVSNRGTSTQIVKNGVTKLHLNLKGNAYNYSAERLKDVRAKEGRELDGEMTQSEKSSNVLYVVQVPLKVKERKSWGYESTFGGDNFENMTFGMKKQSTIIKKNSRGFDHAQIKEGSFVGRFEGTRNLKLERDERFPIRATIQLYRVSDSGDVSDELMSDIASSLTTVMSYGSDMSSLVVEETRRITETNVKNKVVLTDDIAFF